MRHNGGRCTTGPTRPSKPGHPQMLYADNVTKSFGGFDLFTGVSFSVADGERVALAGPNGAGKTTLLRMLAGEDTPSSGKAGHRNGSVGYLKQESGFDPTAPLEQEMWVAFPETLAIATRLAAIEAELPEVDDLKLPTRVLHLPLAFEDSATLDAVARGESPQRGDFATGVFQGRVRRNTDRIQVQLSRDGNAFGVPLKITKGVTLSAGSSTLEVAYLLEGLPPDRSFHLAVEFNFAGLPASADDRFFHRNFLTY